MVMLLFALLAGGVVDALINPVEAMVFNIRNGAPPEISIRVGSGGSNVNRVDFLVPSADIGTGTPVDGNRNINIRLVIRATAANPLTGFLTVDSSTPLDNSSGATIGMSEISWTARNGDIPSGNYAETSNQQLASFTSSVRVSDRHTFSYANRTIYDAGTYNGQVTYTWSAP
jgi:hypothetical protein